MIHLVKLCVGADRVEDLITWQKQAFPGGTPCHITRMWPKREQDILSGGSLYWVFKGIILARQRITGLTEVTGADGIRRCAIELDPEVIRTEALPRRPFQGWRYLEPADAPTDLPRGRASRADEPVLPRELQAALAEIGLR